MAKHFADRGFTKGAEVGVADGRYSEILCENIPNLELMAVDPFYRPGHYEKTQERLKKYNATIIRKTSMEAVLDVPDGLLDFVFLDGNHRFDFVMEDIIGWSRKVRTGGIVAGHDYYHFNDSGVVEAVNIFTQLHRIELCLTPRNSRSEAHVDDRVPCWYFTKP